MPKATVLTLTPRRFASLAACPSGRPIVVSPSDPQALIAAVGGLIADPAARARLGGAARAYAEREFDIRRLGDQFEGYLLDVRRGRTAAARGRGAAGIAG